MKTITMTVPLEGLSTGKTKPSFETQGFVGEACKSASEFLANALGQVVEDKPTAEMYRQDCGVERVHE